VVEHFVEAIASASMRESDRDNGRRQEYDALDRVARQIIDASRRGLDADVSNLIDSALRSAGEGWPTRWLVR
jgi:hypothetical protein